MLPEMAVAVAPEPVVEMEVAPEVAPAPPAPVVPAKPVWSGMLQCQRHLLLLWPPAPVQQVEFDVQPVEAAPAKEIDLSDEWEVEVVDEPAAAAAVEDIPVEVAAAPAEEPVVELAPVVDNSQAIADRSMRSASTLPAAWRMELRLR